MPLVASRPGRPERCSTTAPAERAPRGAPAEEMVAHKKAAEDAGANTKFTSVEAAGALENLAKAGALNGKRVLIRSDLNVPRDDEGRITNEARLVASVPAIRLALDAGAAVLVMSHLGRPTEGELKPEDSLAGVAVRMRELVGQPIRLVKN